MFGYLKNKVNLSLNKSYEQGLKKGKRTSSISVLHTV